MEKEATIVIIIALVLLSITFITNTTNILGFWEEPYISGGLGTLCDNEGDCRNFCHDNRGQCENYCEANPRASFCNVLYGVIE
jgi:hypothetical protein